LTITVGLLCLPGRSIDIMPLQLVVVAAHRCSLQLVYESSTITLNDVPLVLQSFLRPMVNGLSLLVHIRPLSMFIDLQPESAKMIQRIRTKVGFVPPSLLPLGKKRLPALSIGLMQLVKRLTGRQLLSLPIFLVRDADMADSCIIST